MSWLWLTALLVAGSHRQLAGEQPAGVIMPPTITMKSTCEQMVSWLSPDKQSPVLLQVVSEEYLRLQRNFFLVMQRNTAFSTKNIYLVCLDESSKRFIDANFPFRCVRAKGVPPYPGVWEFRTRVMMCLVKNDFDVLMSDSDALWLRDPIPELAAIKGDLVVQRGSFPQKASEPFYGTTMCMGFALFRAGGAGMVTLLEELLRDTIKYRDDQWGINAAVIRLNIQWDYNQSRSDMRRFESTALGYGIVADLPGNFTVAYLPNSQYSRNCHKVPMLEDGVVAHCFPHPHEPKIKRLGLWFLG